jgi:hypothetical protein
MNPCRGAGQYKGFQVHSCSTVGKLTQSSTESITKFTAHWHHYATDGYKITIKIKNRENCLTSRLM